MDFEGLKNWIRDVSDTEQNKSTATLAVQTAFSNMLGQTKDPLVTEVTTSDLEEIAGEKDNSGLIIAGISLAAIIGAVLYFRKTKAA